MDAVKINNALYRIGPAHR